MPLEDIQGYMRMRKSIDDAAFNSGMHVIYRNAMDGPILIILANNFDPRGKKSPTTRDF